MSSVPHFFVRCAPCTPKKLNEEVSIQLKKNLKSGIIKQCCTTLTKTSQKLRKEDVD